MELYDLGHVSWLDSQLLYHALPRVGREGLFILAPSSPYVCIGWHQDLEQEVDTAYCRERGIPVFRREVGGGAVFLDGRQVFFQLVIHRDNPAARGDKATFYRRMLEPVVAAYGDLGVKTLFRPVNDVVTTEGRKISGTGAAEIGDYLILVGNLIEDFDYATMARVLRVPDEKFRDKVWKSMQENLTTLRRETGRSFGWAEMAGALARRFGEALGPLAPAELPRGVREKADELAPVTQGDEWLLRRGRPERETRDVRVASGVNVIQRVHKAPGGLLRALLEVRDQSIAHASFSGDFFCYPRQALDELERRLRGLALREVAPNLEAFYASGSIETPGVAVSDWLAVIGAPPRSGSPG